MHVLPKTRPETLPSYVSTYLEIDTQAIAANYRELQSSLHNSQCAAVLKADAYGFGIDAVAPLLSQEGCTSFFVAHIEEALRLRNILHHADIYVLSGLLPGTEAFFVENNLIPVLNDFGMLKAWANESQRIRQNLPCALHIDTGMNRCGFDHHDLEKLYGDRDLLSTLNLKLIMSHLVSSHDASDPLNAQQKEKFEKTLSHLPQAKISLADTGGIYLGPSYHYDFVRPGKGLFGLFSPPKGYSPLQPCLKLFGRVIQVRQAKKGESVGYGATHVLVRDSRLATLGIGFADGYPRPLSNKAYVDFHGFQAPVVGRISMDYTVVDVTDVPEEFCATGCWAELVNETLSLDKLATWTGGISRELSTGFNSRLTKVYR